MPESKKYYYLYQITNLLNGKIYIGIHATCDLGDGYMGSGKRLLGAYRAYGKHNFKKEILQFYDSLDSVLEAERRIVTEDFCKRPDTYNIAVGGKCGGSLIAGKSPEERAAWVQHIQAVRKAQSQTPEWRAMRKRVRNSPQFVQKFQATRRATELAMSDEQKQKRRATLKAAHNRPEAKAHHADASILRYARLTEEERRRRCRFWYNDGKQNFLLRPEDPKVKDLTPGRIWRPGPKYAYRVEEHLFYSEHDVYNYLKPPQAFSAWKRHNKSWLRSLRQKINH